MQCEWTISVKLWVNHLLITRCDFVDFKKAYDGVELEN